MGNCVATSSDPEADKTNKAIAKQLKGDGDKFLSEIRLLLLGAGESGKSTIAKQMRIIHMNGFTEEERDGYKSLIYQNVWGGIKILCKAANDLDIKVKDKKARAVHKKVMDEDSEYFSGVITKEMVKDLQILWGDAGIQGTFERRAEFQLSDSVPYYMEHLERLADENYTPNEQDILRSRAKTTGIIETEFEVDGTKFRMVDVGGQRSERKKWMHCFQDVTSVLFCVALSEYDLKLEEDNETNRMAESISLFGQICNSKWFVNTSMILFLNKRDLFQEKIKKVSLTIAFGDYTGPNEWEKCSEFISEKFAEQNKQKNKQIYAHITCATDTGNVRFVFNAVKDIILHQALDASGLNI